MGFGRFSLRGLLVLLDLEKEEQEEGSFGWLPAFKGADLGLVAVALGRLVPARLLLWG